MFPALILAGGASVRMGRNKATMIVDGAPMIVHVAHALYRHVQVCTGLVRCVAESEHE